MNQYDVLTFDCYGTLIDWESGIRNSFRNALARTGAKTELSEKTFELYSVHEGRLEKVIPHLSYREVLTRSAEAVAQEMGWDLPSSEASFLAEDLPKWIPFADTSPALATLAKKHTLGILSNVDNDLLSGTLKHFDTRFNILVTAQNVGSYKPARGHFKEARRLIGDRRWLHVAASQYHDIEPAVELGINVVWVNRKGISHSEKRVPVVKNLEELVDNLRLYGAGSPPKSPNSL